MPPKITSVKWRYNSWLPEGILFDENTGTFTGTPSSDDVGEFVIPITVKTNYGTDTKNVTIIVDINTNVYAAGIAADNWANGGVPDKYGFYKLNVPVMERLVAHHDGWGGLTKDDHKYYFCGSYLPYSTIDTTTQSSLLTTVNTPSCLYDKLTGELPNMTVANKEILSGVDKVIDMFYYTSGSEGSYNVTRSGGVLILWNSGLAKYIAYPAKAYVIKVHKTYTNDTTRIYSTIPTSAYTISGVSAENGSTAFDDTPYVRNTELHYLTDSARAIRKKVFQYNNHFAFLSIDNHLDNDPDKFTHGTIKDAWAYDTAFYVQTTDNGFYQYVSSSKTWNLLGTYDIKKVEIPSSNRVFLLTNDGELYHKGTVITGLFDEAHNTLTRVFPELAFKDFTFGGNTLTVLRE